MAPLLAHLVAGNPPDKTYLDFPVGTGKGLEILYWVMGKRSFVLKSLGGVGGVCLKTTP